MNYPKIALVGRPNVGKSSLFNRIAKRRMAIVDELEGVTRDRLYSDAELFGRPFKIIDTGGIDSEEKIPFWKEVKDQALLAIEEADALIMVVDAQVGITQLDQTLARFLLGQGKPIILAINKIDSQAHKDLIHDFYGLGISEMIGVSAVQGDQIAELIELALEHAGEGNSTEEEEKAISVAILGRPNVGKSTFLNHLLHEERSIVSPIAGTTRDSIDALVEWGGKRYRLIDTAGLRRKSKEPEVVDKFSRIRTERAIERADICLFMLDSEEGITSQEKKILKDIEERGKGLILFFNKWDLIKGFRQEHCIQQAERDLPFLEHCPLIFGSAMKGQGIKKVFDKIDQVYASLTMRITTGRLNKFLERAMQLNHPPMIKGKRLRIYYMTQISTLPPRFVLFINYKDRVLGSYLRYLMNQFRDTYGFEGVPLQFVLKERKSTPRERSQAPDLEGPHSVEELAFESVN